MTGSNEPKHCLQFQFRGSVFTREFPKAWEEERDDKLQNPTWNLNGQQVGLCKVDSANCVWTIREKTRRGFQGEPLGMVIAYVDDLIAVGQQEQLNGKKASLDALYTMKTSGTVPAEYSPGIEPLKFLGCFIERIPSGKIVMHQRSYIDHCLKNNNMLQLKIAKGFPCVDEKSPPEETYDEHGQPTSFEERRKKRRILSHFWLSWFVVYTLSARKTLDYRLLNRLLGLADVDRLHNPGQLQGTPQTQQQTIPLTNRQALTK